ncbi:MAG: hypothetical protein K6F84_02290, partial [Lachnospiraceae bacterium]|nr:hypothetical protein [Lachnospiraceae bacterium]
MKKLKSFLGLLMAGVFTFTGVVSDAGALTVQAKTQSGSAQYRSVLYYGDWSIYDGQEKYFPSKINAKNITHLNFAFMDVDASGNLVFTDEYADSQAIMDGESYNDAGAYNGVLGAMSILRSKNPNVKIGISVGGWTRSGDFTTIGKSSSLRKTFAKNVTKFVDDLGFDFVDIDWEYPTDYRDPDPKGNGVSIDEGCHGAPEDGENFVLLMEDIRSELDKLEASNGKHYELSSAMSASPSFMDVIDYKRLLKSADFVNMMTYDMNGAWADFTAHHTALYTNPKYDKSTMAGAALSVDSTIKYLKQKYGSNIDYSQIVVGVAPYTRGWGGVQSNGLDSSNPGLYANATPNSVLDSANDTTSGTFQYRELSKLKSMYNLTEYYDEVAEAPYLYNASTGYFFTYDNARSIKAKGQYVRNNGLGGLICWMAASDDASSTITTAMKDSLFGSSSIPENEILTSAPNVSITPTASGKQYCFVFKNNENATASNAPLKVAEKFKQTVMNPTVYITFKSGAKAVSGIEAGSFKNDGNTVVVDLSGVYAAKALGAGKSHTFYITVDKDADVSDIASIYVSQKITTDLPEFGKALVYGNNSAPTAAPTQAPTAKPSKAPTAAPTAKPSKAPTAAPTQAPTAKPSKAPTAAPSQAPTAKPSKAPTAAPTQAPTAKPTAKPTSAPNPGNEWAEGNTYTRGTVVSYNGSNYECIVTHTAYVGANWTPDTTPTLWKQVAGSVA